MMVDETHPAGAPADSPVDADAPTEDRIGTAGWAMSSAAATGVAWFSLLTFVQSLLLAGSTARTIAQVDPKSFDVNFMAYGIPLGFAVAGMVGWFLMISIPSSYRRGGLAMVGAFAGSVLGMLLTMAARVVGPPLLLGLAVAAAACALWLGRRAVRSAR
jgi:hypothetical protein